MTHDHDKTGHPGAKADGDSWDRIARDWLDLWERELAARLSDPAQVEMASGMIADWISRFGIKTAHQGQQKPDETVKSQTTSSDNASGTPSGAAPAAAAPGHGLDELDIARRLGLLEDRLGRIEKRLAGKPGLRQSRPAHAKAGKPHGAKLASSRRGPGGRGRK